MIDDVGLLQRRLHRQALAALGQRVGILDADIYGPSIPRMLGLSGKPEIKNDKMVPLAAHFSLKGDTPPATPTASAAPPPASLKLRRTGCSVTPALLSSNAQCPVPSAHSIICNSMGFLLDESQAAVWRGPMITKALYQLARLTDWGLEEASRPTALVSDSAQAHCAEQEAQRRSNQKITLLVDMPPGTGDIHLSMVQQVPLNGVIL